jgi:hypothetical protein
MQVSDQRHCLDVYRWLQNRGCNDPDTLTAALIHDAGKGRLAGGRIRLWHRVMYVLLAPAPSLLAAFARASHGMTALVAHGEVTVRLAAEHGAPEGVLRLLHELDGRLPTGERGTLLQAADDSC